MQNLAVRNKNNLVNHSNNLATVLVQSPKIRNDSTSLFYKPPLEPTNSMPVKNEPDFSSAIDSKNYQLSK